MRVGLTRAERRRNASLSTRGNSRAALRRERERGAHIEQLERRIHALKQARQVSRVTRPLPRLEGREPDLRTQVEAFLRSPAYNKAFAGGHQSSGIVPLPAQGADKQPRSFMPCKGTMSGQISLAAGQTVLLALNPYAQSPIAAALNLPTVGTNVGGTTHDFAVWSYGNGSTITVEEGTWIGGVDPRTMISGFDGPYSQEVDPTAFGTQILQQFMGGSFNCTATAGWDTNGRIAVIDSKSYPSFWGTKMSPYTTVGSSRILPADDYINVPDAEDTFQNFRPSGYALVATPEQLLAFVQNTSIVGGSDVSAAHLNFTLVPEGTRWAPWNGAFNDGVALPTATWNNATIGAVPARNWDSFLSSGMQLVMLTNDGTGSPITLRYKAQFFYNVHIPTEGPKAIPVLAAIAPVTRPHVTDATAIHSVPTFSHMHVAHAGALHVKAAIQNSVRAGATDAALYITHPPDISPCISAKAPSAADPGVASASSVQNFVGGLLKNVGPKKILDAVKDPSSVLKDLNPEKLLSDPVSLLGDVASLF